MKNRLNVRSKKIMNLSEKKIAIIGLGYVGLPLAVAFAEKYKVIGFDINDQRVDELNTGHDATLEVEDQLLNSVLDIENCSKTGLHLTTNKEILDDCNIYIVTVPTPIDKNNRTVLTPMIKASETIAAFLKKGNIVIYESTVYPGVTEDEMVPMLEKNSGLKYNADFYCGYSPERINPGDKEHTVTKILKVTSGSTPEIATIVDNLYKSIITAGTHKAPSIKVAEAAKVIENSQRDINIAFVNELSKIFNLIGIDTNEVLEVASTKWNFLNFKPGLVGGHCIGVDPYYLAQKAQEVGYHPKIILAGRRLNDGMGKYVSSLVIKMMIKKNIQINGAKIIILGLAFKENCPDIRNTKVIDIYHELITYNSVIDIFDPLVNNEDVMKEFGISMLPSDSIIDFNQYAAIIVAVAHNEFANLEIETSQNRVVFDVKGNLSNEKVDGRL